MTDLKEQITDLHRAGFSFAEIGEMIGKPKSTVFSIYRNGTIPEKRALLDELESIKAELKELKNQQSGMNGVGHKSPLSIHEAMARLVAEH